MISRISILFAIPVELTDDECHRLSKWVGKICDRHKPEGMVYWPSGQGSTPMWSKADAVFMGHPVDPNAPDTGEPSFDHGVYQISTCAREAYPEEIRRDQMCEEATRKRKSTRKYRTFTWLHERVDTAHRWLDRMERE